MLVTEAEAKAKQCCRDLGKKCVASICMAWAYRNFRERAVERRAVATPTEKCPDGFDGYDVEKNEWVRVERLPQGSCGLTRLDGWAHAEKEGDEVPVLYNGPDDHDLQEIEFEDDEENAEASA